MMFSGADVAGCSHRRISVVSEALGSADFQKDQKWIRVLAIYRPILRATGRVI
jgi:hypothetical protein